MFGRAARHVPRKSITFLLVEIYGTVTELLRDLGKNLFMSRTSGETQ